jgi:hypothetical protein
MIRRFFAGAALVALIGTALIVRFGGGQDAGAYSPLAQLPLTSTGIHLVELFNYNVHDHIADERGHVDYVYGASSYWALKDQRVPGVKHDWYTLFNRDDNEDTQHPLAWFRANHPDWIEYRCNRTTPVYGKSWTALDVTNPAIQDYQMPYIERAMDGGYNGVDFDVTDTFNYQHVCGHYDANGHWIQQYSGAVVDQPYRRDMVTAFRSLADRIHATAEARNIPFTIAINASFDTWKPFHQVEDLFPYADVVLDEGGLTNYAYNTRDDRVLAVKSDTTRSQWRMKMRWYHDLHRMGKVLIINGEVPHKVDATHPAAKADRQWILANYLLTKDDHTYQALITGFEQYGGPYYPQPEYKIDIGTPVSGMHRLHGAWARTYTNGLALVNPSAHSTLRVRLPAGQYADCQHRPVGRVVTLKPGSGLILLAIAGRVAVASPDGAHSRSQTTTTARAVFHLIANGGFGLQSRGWFQHSNGRSQLVDGAHTHTGWYAGDLCGYAGCHERLGQIVKLPAHFSRVRVNYWREVVAPQGHTASTATTFVGQIRDANGRRIVTFGHLHGPLHTAVWSRHAVDLTTALLPYRGKTVRLVFGARASSPHPASIYVDNVSFNAVVSG